MLSNFWLLHLNIQVVVWPSMYVVVLLASLFNPQITSNIRSCLSRILCLLLTSRFITISIPVDCYVQFHHHDAIGRLRQSNVGGAFKFRQCNVGGTKDGRFLCEEFILRLVVFAICTIKRIAIVRFGRLLTWQHNARRRCSQGWEQDPGDGAREATSWLFGVVPFRAKMKKIQHHNTTRTTLTWFLVGHSGPKLWPNQDRDILPHCKYHKELKFACTGLPMKCRWSYCPMDGRHGWWPFLSGALAAWSWERKVKCVQASTNLAKRNN